MKFEDSILNPKRRRKSNKACSRMPCDNIDTLDSERSYNYDFGISKDNRIHAMPQSMNAQKFQAILSEINTFIFDADGVLWLGEDAIPGSPKFIDFLLGMNKRIIVLTNNATKSREVYAKKLAKLGYDKRIGKHNIVNPAAVVADTLFRAGLHKQNKKVYLIGGQGVKDELDDLNIEYFGDGPDPVDAQASSKGAAFLYDIDLEEETENVGAVVVGYEKYFNYLKLMKAANYLQQEDCLFVATNEDETCPGPNPSICIPDAGPLVAAVKTASGREPLVVGKPNTPAFDYICRRWQIDPTRTMMIGDRTNTDVKFGKDHGLRTMLVLSGCHQVDDIVENQMNDRDDMVPEYYATCLGALIPGSDQTVPTLRKLSLESN
ncbi:haloacid dehalogenase-like hydrolase domain-containing protein [Ditylenchus destructor]|uniref:Haloacid dehalogenase-like hydrolase domain-containing protein n=1 Tax=Ditylenchus destructor TaxID=166010 RepID=A0AAD4NAG1_9BILA|nr:haloacid dehalogenase-like hydrolase domain-containing protein [Ditylenchus destructor]